MILSHRYKFIMFSNGRTGSKGMEYVLKKFDDNAKHPFLWKIAQLIRGYLPVPNKMFPSTLHKISSILAYIAYLPFQTKIEFPRTTYAHVPEHVFPIFVKSVLDKKIWNEYFKFVFVRNPWDLVISRYFVNNRKKAKTMKKFTREHFLEFWEQMKKYNAIKGEEHPFQYQFVIGPKGERLVDFVGRFESLQEDFNIICDKIGIPRKNVPQLGKIKRNAYRDYYTEESRQLVAERFHKDIELFGYEF